MIATVFRAAFVAHLAAGGVAFLTFWVPLVTTKGGKLHRRIGWAYVAAAATLAVTGFMLCAQMLTDGRANNDILAVFLAYVGLLAAASTQIGVRALRARPASVRESSLADLAPPVLLLAGGVGIAVLGIARGVVLYAGFALLGIALGTGQLRFWLRPPQTKVARVLQHINGMGTSCITTFTAFFVANARRVGLRPFDLLVWTVPIGIGAAGLTWWRRRYAKQAGPQASLVEDGSAETP